MAKKSVPYSAMITIRISAVTARMTPVAMAMARAVRDFCAASFRRPLRR